MTQLKEMPMKQKCQGRVVLRTKQATAIEITQNANASVLRTNTTSVFIFNLVASPY